MNRKLVAKSNFVLRRVLNTKENIDIIKDFIESILGIEIEEIKQNEYLRKKEKYLPSEENFGVVDCRIKTTNGEEINIGIQCVDGIYIQTKMLLYYSQIHLNQLEYDDNREFARTITINLLDFNYFETKNYEKKITIETNEKNVKSKEIELHVIELPKIKYNTDKMNRKKEWITYMEGSNIKEIEKITARNKYINKLDKQLEYYWQNETME